MARIATTMRPTTQIASMITAAGSIGPEIALVERINVTLHRPKVIAIVTAKAMASFARLLRLRGGGSGGFCSGRSGVGVVFILCSEVSLGGRRRVSRDQEVVLVVLRRRPTG